ncbi:MAG: serine hydroxymethyltransferase [Proteobacteria bacterium]|nr:serine hydroxymethyltransferase [Pseudomonadota bacterium]MBU4277873.1 serine hydroxymethyltransferase [Pseudomonadota bacterium]MBU4384878.1 serine hydroxymethyltransferase [Pseudomonadota bacterium]MBU4605259.1 serine hydroxymethyltransferase [Pseudomonadota bacterium]MCG2763804.1 serine hydroxymethyltransferase [Desulfarculaceae bacterium]
MDPLHSTDPEIAALIDKEALRQASVLRMIPSENYASPAVLAATGSILCNKYSEGYPAKRYYQGQENIDEVEMLAISRAKALFGAEHANVQPYSGSPANMAVYLGLLGKGGRVLGMDLAAGGHLTHGAKASFSGTFYDVVSYGLSREDGRIDYAQARRLAQEFKPQMIFCGASSYPRVVDFAAFAEIAAEVGARLVADISHISGLCVTGQHPAPFPHADVVTSTTHKLLRGPRGGMVLCRQELAKAIDKAVFPGLQGGPHNQTTAAIAVALKEAATPAYADYCRQVVANSKALAEGLLERGFTLVTGGTDNHLVLIDAGASGLTGKAMAIALEKAGIVANANKIPFDPRSANDPSGLRMGTPALTTRGMGTAEMDLVAGLVAQAAANIEDEGALANIRELVADLCVDFPAPGIAPSQC